MEPSQSPHNVSAGVTLSLRCIAHGYPHPKVQWYQNDTLIKQQHPGEYYLVPTISSHTTVYACVASNTIGNTTHTASKTITVVVQGNKE